MSIPSSLPDAPENSALAVMADQSAIQPDPREAARLAATIDISSPMSIVNFGQDIAEQTASYADELLQKARTSDLDEVGEMLSTITVAAQNFNISSLDSKWSRTPVIGLVVKKLVLTKERMLARFETVKSQIEELVDNVDETAQKLEARSADFQSMYQGVKEEHATLENHVAAIDICLANVDQGLAALAQHTDDIEVAEQNAVLEATRNSLEKRIGDLKVLQHSALQTLPMIRVMQANNVALVDKFHTIRRLTLPAWKRTFLMALTLEEQRNAVGLADTIDDATNEFMKRNADMLYENSVTTAKANQRMVVDIDTLRHVHNKVLDTLVDVKTAHEEGAMRRESIVGELETLRGEMVTAYGRAAVMPPEEGEGAQR